WPVVLIRRRNTGWPGPMGNVDPMPSVVTVSYRGAQLRCKYVTRFHELGWRIELAAACDLVTGE
ncbi:MAG: hypothetical protein ABSG18_18050, partial [Steroidobacteraceae bacterium]